jgi:hypothetical protein
MLQATIARFATQSTTVKGWCVTLTAALLGFGVVTLPLVAVLAIYVIVVFAVLDAYYLALERAYRRLYDEAASGQVGDWTLTVARPTTREVAAALASPPIALLYGTSLLAAAVIASYLHLP